MDLAPPRRRARDVLRAAVAPFLVLVTPFVIFLHYQRYGLAHPDAVGVLVILAGLAGCIGLLSSSFPSLTPFVLAGLLTFFADVQLGEPGERKLFLLFLILCAVLWVIRRHAAGIVSPMIATVLALSLVTPRSDAGATERWTSGAAGDLPLMLHLVLDEHIGLDGLPGEVATPGFRDELESFYVRHGFRLFGRAYSEYPSTLWSLSHLLNFAPGGYIDGLSAPGAEDGTFRLRRNAYFQRLADAGYSIRVHQPEYLDVCAAGVPRTSCDTYRANSLDALDRLPAPPIEKARVVAGSFLGRSELYARAKDVYRGGRERLRRAGIHAPAWNWERSTSAPLGTMPAWDAVEAELTRAQRGQFLYAHLLMPHYPYMYDAGCAPRPPKEWLTRSDVSGDRGTAVMNTADGRALRYRRYLEQVRCTVRKIDRLLTAMPSSLRRDAIVIVQGDHGSRISLVDPVATAKASPAVSDYADNFSTLFAVRAPELERGYDAQPAAVTCLLRAMVNARFTSSFSADACTGEHVVHFWNGGMPQPRPFRPFWSDVQ